MKLMIRLFLLGLTYVNEVHRRIYILPHCIFLHDAFYVRVRRRKNWRYKPIYSERIRATKFCPDHNFSWYLSVSKINTTLSSGHFQNDRVVHPILIFWRALSIECLENTIGVELEDS